MLSDLDMLSVRSQLDTKVTLSSKSKRFKDNLEGFYSRVVLEVPEASQNRSP